MMQLSGIDSLVRMLTLSHVPRWAIIDVTKRQNVGEHSYRVMAIALVICNYISTHMSITIDEGQVLKEAILHDIDESETGDIPTPFKKKAGLSKDKPDTIEAYIMGLSDLIEALIYLQRYGVRSDRIVNEIREKVASKCRDLQTYLNCVPKTFVDFRVFISDIIRAGSCYE